MTASVAPGAAGGAPALSFYDTGGHHPENGTLLGFWLYLMSDCLVFACLFATYGVLGRNYAGGPSGAELFELPLVAVNTSLLLLSSITYGFAVIAHEAQASGRDARMAGRHRFAGLPDSSASNCTSSQT